MKKVIAYLLYETHPDGRSKAAFFSRFGFSVARWEESAEMLIKHGKTYPVVKTARSEYGISYCVDGPIETPSGDCPAVRTVWITEEGSASPRLVTAYPI